MLTDKEREWLMVRKKACARCGKVPSRCSQDQRNACYRAGFPLWDKTTVTFCSLRDAAEFEARVSRRLAVMLYMFQGLAALKMPPPTPDWFLKQARLTEEAAMEMEKEKYKC